MHLNDPINIKTMSEKKQRGTDVGGLAKQVLPGYPLPGATLEISQRTGVFQNCWQIDITYDSYQVKEFAFGTLILWIQKHIM